ncbi:hypothetical protein SAMN02799624_01904 [Paenibacillus sp. UNC496MF]|uniref:DUF6220 domain-containing protein n=1 Tax=Paenibacillus sp. UNC496MF TaxID=1502753 RepID=UPI0008E3EECC|nr:DUF6220 domain-containing protein [Paenibacillus sp. UNC496MF]SFI72724.1 hypothetical protein SAMN02799624_01904 [Paenibacillus sp. UNC496MF]
MSEGNRYARLAVFLLAALFALCVVVQTYLAGMAVLVDAEHWKAHTSFVHVFEFVPAAAFVLTFFGRVGGAVRWCSLVLFALVMLQYMTAHIGADAPYVSALHPVIAVAMFWLAAATAMRAYRAWRRGPRA